MKYKMNRWLIVAVLFWGCSTALWGQKPKAYIPVEQMPDLIQCLPPPPAKDSPAFQYDKQRYKWGKEQRKNPERAAQACRDAIWTYEALMQEFSNSFGMLITKEGTPAIWNVVTRSLRTIGNLSRAPKAHYQRLRPFEYYKEPTLSGEDDGLRGQGSYPSGHTLRATAAGLVMGQINPANANAIFARAWDAGESRVIVGAHWQSDVDNSRAAASIAYAKLQTSREFRRQVAKARAEFLRITK